MAADNVSMQAITNKLKEGESCGRVVRIPLQGKIKPGAIKQRIARIRNSMNQIASRAREATGRTYTVETGSFVNHDESAVIGTISITCMEDEGEDDI